MRNTEEFHFKPALLPLVLAPRGEAPGRVPLGSAAVVFVLWQRVWPGLCAAFLGWHGRLSLRRQLRACRRFDRVQGFAKPRVFGSLDFIHKGSSLVLQLLRKQKSQKLSKPN